MTSRVQKGGPIFKPLVRPKSRPPAATQSRQPSVILEQDHSAPIFPSLSPPAYLQENITPAPTDVFSQIDAGATSASRPVGFPVLAPSLSMPPPAPKSPSLRGTSLVTVSQPVTFPSVVSPPASLAVSAPPRPAPIPIMPPVESPASNDMQNPVAEGSSAQFTPRMALTVENVVKRPQRRISKAVVEPHNPDAEANGDEDVNDNDLVNGPEKKKRKRRTSVKNASVETEGGGEVRPKRKKRTARSKQPVDIVADDSDDGEQVKKPRGRARKRRSASLPAFDPNADPGEDIDPTVMTMAALCSDTGQGRVSSKAQEILDNHSAWKAANRERRARMKVMMERKKYGQPEDDEEDPPAPASIASIAEPSASDLPPTSPSAVASTSAVMANADPESFDYSQHLTASRFNVQVRIGPNGETIIDEESLVIDRTDGAEEDTSGYTHVVESDRSRFTNSSTYGKKLRGTRWSAEETELFYDALSQYGENYELISYVLPGRDRKSCKNKFKAEDKRNPARINYCLNNSIPVDINMLSRMTGRDFSGPTPEIAMPKIIDLPAPSTSAAVPEEGQPEATNRDVPSSSKTRKHSRSRSHTVGLEEGLMVIGDLDSFDKEWED